MSREGQANIKALTYLVETSDEKAPPASTLGGRYYSSTDPNSTISGPFKPRSDQANGHISRNIRLLYSLAEGIKPSIEIISVKLTKKGYELNWVVLGCVTKINESSFGLALDDLVSFKTDFWSCYYRGTSESVAVFTATLSSEAVDRGLTLVAKVDQDLTVVPELLKDNIRPSFVTSPVLDISKDRKTPIVKNVTKEELWNLQAGNTPMLELDPDIELNFVTEIQRIEKTEIQVEPNRPVSDDDRS